MKTEAVISAYDCSTIYEVPVVLYEQKLDEFVLAKLKLPNWYIKLEDWQNFVNTIKILEKLRLQLPVNM